MANTLSYSAFSERVNEVFKIIDGAATVELELMECNQLTAHPAGDTPQRESFSLVFRGPMNLALPQRTFSLQNVAMGPMEIFLVPIGPDGKGLQYEAVFN